MLSRVTFKDDWPTERTKPLYERAAREGNFEANMKLGVACLYGEGCAAAPQIASEMLMRAEQLAGPNDPFSWLLYRPPWSSDTCSKALIFKDMLKLAEDNKDVLTKRYSGIMYCAAKTLWCVSSSSAAASTPSFFLLLLACFLLCVCCTIPAHEFMLMRTTQLSNLAVFVPPPLLCSHYLLCRAPSQAATGRRVTTGGGEVV